MKIAKRVMCFGTFDLLHPGHIKFLARARALGDELIVVLAQDARRANLFKQPPIFNLHERLALVGALKSVNRAVAGDQHDILAMIKKYRPQIIALGHDQKFGVDLLRAWIKTQKKPPQIVRLPALARTRNSSTRIRKILCR